MTTLCYMLVNRNIVHCLMVYKNKTPAATMIILCNIYSIQHMSCNGIHFGRDVISFKKYDYQ